SSRSEIEGEPVILTAVARSGELVGILPLYLERVRVRQLLSINRLQLMGNCWSRSDLALIGQHMGPIVRRGWSGAVSAAFAATLHEWGAWDEFCSQYHSPEYRFMAELAARMGVDGASPAPAERVAAYRPATATDG